MGLGHEWDPDPALRRHEETALGQDPVLPFHPELFCSGKKLGLGVRIFFLKVVDPAI